MRLLLLADQPVVHAGFKEILRGDQDLIIVDQASSTPEACRKLPASRADVVVVQLVQPGMDEAATRQLRQGAPHVRVLIVTKRCRLGDLLAALGAGAYGVALSTEPVEALRAALRAVGHGREYITPLLAPLVVRRKRVRPVNVVELLSLRERQVLELVARGSRIASVAQAFGVSRKTVETHVHRLHRKLGCHNLGDLVRFAAEHGLLPAADGGAEVREVALGLATDVGESDDQAVEAQVL
jgi:DNA-binding NarL/FixJ family response regulator